MSCPVRRVIAEVRGAGLNESGAVKIGGSESSCTIVCDSMDFYITSRKMDFARFELMNPDIDACARKCDSMFVGTYAELYRHLIDKVIDRHLYTQFTQLIKLIGDMESVIISKIAIAARTNAAINVTLPNILLLPHIDSVILYRPDLLCLTVNKIIDYMNKINVNVILRSPLIIKIDRVPMPNIRPIDMSREIERPVAGSAHEYLVGIKRSLDMELEVAAYAQDVEKYHCEIIARLNIVFDYCKKIINGIGA